MECIKKLFVKLNAFLLNVVKTTSVIVFATTRNNLITLRIINVVY